MAADNRHHKAGTLTREQLEKRFTTDGKDFAESLAVVLAGGSESQHEGSADEREAEQ